jgi:DNA-binding NtrC family response regulator
MKLRATNTRKSNVILAIDDDWLVLDSFKQLLESQGWAVCTAANPMEDLRQYEAHWPEIKLVLLDYSIDTMTGDEVFERLQLVNQSVRVILITGSDGDVAVKMFEKGLWGFMPKPVAPEDLIDRVREAIYTSNRLAPGAV